MTSHVLPVPRTLGASPSERYIFAYALHCKLTNLISLLTAVIVGSFCPLCSVRIFDVCFVHGRSFWVPYLSISVSLVPYLFVALGGATDALRQAAQRLTSPILVGSRVKVPRRVVPGSGGNADSPSLRPSLPSHTHVGWNRVSSLQFPAMMFLPCFRCRWMPAGYIGLAASVRLLTSCFPLPHTAGENFLLSTRLLVEIM